MPNQTAKPKEYLPRRNIRWETKPSMEESGSRLVTIMSTLSYQISGREEGGDREGTTCNYLPLCLGLYEERKERVYKKDLRGCYKRHVSVFKMKEGSSFVRKREVCLVRDYYDAYRHIRLARVDIGGKSPC